jgi:hypothetical protein
MTVAELRDFLETIDGERLVVLQKDAEGNGFSPLDGYWQGAYRAETTWYGDAGLEALTDKHREAGYDDEDVIYGEPALILTPVN